MLAPELDRLDYGEQLNPPIGFELDSAIATTYSLDLNALLAVPVALCFNDTLDGNIKGEKLALLEAIGQLKGKLKVFYQKGNISYPSQFNRLFTLLEPCLHPIVPVEGAFSSFHPKLWLLRFIESEPAKKKPNICYRLIVLSRNLTFDRSWDVAISLDGVIDRKNADASKNKQWIDFIKNLLKEDKKFSPASDMAKELDQVVWKSPDKFSDVKILIGGGINGRPVNIEQKNNDELMVVSPFLKSSGGGVNALEWLASFAPEGNKYLFSRSEELNAIGAEKLAEWNCYAINEDIVNGEERNDVGDTSTGETPLKQNLHAKLIIQQQGNKAYWHVGSANATTAAMGDATNSQPRNTESMVSMMGASSKVGPKLLREQWLAEKGPQLFVQHEFQDISADDSENIKLLLRETLHQLISSEWQLAGTQEHHTYLYRLKLNVNLCNPLANGVSVSVGQLAIPGSRPLADEMIWDNVEYTNISALIPVHVVIRAKDKLVEKRLVIEAKLSLEGGDSRDEQIMKAMMDSPEKILNYLRLLLQFSPDKNQWLSFENHGGEGFSDYLLSGNPILEQLLLASSRHPKLLKRIDSSLKRLTAANVDIPEEFLGLWKYFKKEAS